MDEYEGEYWQEGFETERNKVDSLESKVKKMIEIVEDYKLESKAKQKNWAQGIETNPSATADDASEWAYAAGQILIRFRQMETE